MNCPSAQRWTRASFWRGGTSNGVYLDSKNVPGWDQVTGDRRSDLPFLQNLVNDFLANIMGAPDQYMRQLNGMGQGISSTSKVMIVQQSNDPDIDIDFWFVQVGIPTGKVDMSGNCGNLTSAVAPFALNNGVLDSFERNLVPNTIKADELGQKKGTMCVTMRNWNTNKIIINSFSVIDDFGWRFDEDGDYGIDGVSQTSTPISIDLIDPAGARIGKGALPTGNPIDTLMIDDGNHVQATLSDISNPGVFVDGRQFDFDNHNSPESLTTNVSLMNRLELIRRAGASKMGLDPEIPGTPAIVLVYPPSADDPRDKDVDIVARALSMKQAHKALQMTYGTNLGACTKIPGTIPSQLARKESQSSNIVTVGHPTGKATFGAEVVDGMVKSVKYVRTARPLMEGFVNHHRAANPPHVEVAR